MIEGVFAPIPTPFKNGQFDPSAIKQNLTELGKSSLAGVVALGSNGEFPLLGHEEKVKVVSAVLEYAPDDFQVIVGGACESTKETHRFIDAIDTSRVSGILAITPHYYKGSMNRQALRTYYFSIADGCDVPVLIYNMPRNTGLNLSSDTVAELSSHPNITGIKDSSGDIVQIAETVAKTDSDFTVFAGSASFLLAALAVGARGATVALANIWPQACTEIFDAFQCGEWATARELQLRVLPLNRAVTATWGVAGLKAAMDLLGFCGGEPRAPVLPLSQTEVSQLRRIMLAAGLPA